MLGPSTLRLNQLTVMTGDGRLQVKQINELAQIRTGQNEGKTDSAMAANQLKVGGLH